MGFGKQLTRLAALWSVMLFGSALAIGQQPNTSAAEFWPTVNAHVELGDNWRMLGLAELKKGEEGAYQQFDSGVGIGHRWSKIKRAHLENIDPDKEHSLLLGAGYENLYTMQPGKSKIENRAVLESLSGLRLTSALLGSDRNRIEFRWVDGVYSTRYRNNLKFEYDVKAHGFQLSPYVSAEAFYDGSKSSWNEEQYSAGVQLPIRRVLMLQAYYLNQHSTTSSPAHINAAGITLNFYLNNK